MQQPVAACKVCDRGSLFRVKVHRMSGPAVVIGYILLIPSLIGIAIAFVMFCFSLTAGTTAVDGIQNEATAQMRRASIPEPLIRRVVLNPSYEPTAYDGVNEEQIGVVKNAEITLAAGSAGAGIGGALGAGFSIFLGIVALVSGLLGWLLVMRKKVLKCSNCEAIVNAT